MVELRLLGPTELTGPDGTEIRGILTHRRRLALLSYLALQPAGSFSRRETLTGLLWPESSERRARARLSVVLHHVRRRLGKDVVLRRGIEEIGLDAEAIRVDIREFLTAIDEDDRARAAELYRGHLLDGFHLSNASGFTQWLERERRRLRMLAVTTLTGLARSAMETDPEKAYGWAGRAAVLAPYDEEANMSLIESLARSTHPAEALRVLEAFKHRLSSELELDPSERLLALERQVRSAGDGGPPRSTPPLGPTARAYAGPERSDEASALGGSERQEEAAKSTPTPSPLDSSRPNATRRLTRLAIPLATAAGLVLVATARWPDPNIPSAPGRSLRVSNPFIEGQAPLGEMRFTPDGSALVYEGPGPNASESQLWIRRLDALQAQPIPGTRFAGGGTLALSPDGTKTALAHLMVSPQPLKIVSLDRRETRELGVNGFAVSAWTEDGIYYHPGPATVARIPASGGVPDTLVSGDQRIEYYMAYVPLGRGDRGIVEVRPAGQPWPSLAELWMVDATTGARKRLVAGNTPRLTTAGHLMFATSDGTLMTASFDEEGGLQGEPWASLDQRLFQTPDDGDVFYDISADGTLAYMTGASEGGRFEFVWLDRQGRVTELPSSPSFEPGLGAVRGWKLSPDHRKLAFQGVERGNTDLYVLNLDLGVVTRLTFDPAMDRSPRWSPNGDTIVFNSRRGLGALPTTLWTKPSDGSGESRLLSPTARALVGVPSPDNAWLILRTTVGDEDSEILGLRPGVDSLPVLLVPGAGSNEYAPTISPDGRWLAYHSDETGRDEVYVRPFPTVTDAKWQVSAKGGRIPIWGNGGAEIFYYEPETRALVAVRYEARSAFEIRGRSTLFALPLEFMTDGDFYDVSGDDDRFLLARRRPAAEWMSSARTDFWHGFLDELRR